MKVIKPQKLSLLTRCFEYARQPQLGVAILTLHELSRALVSEMDMWKFVAEQLGGETAPDAGIPKSRAEVVVTGSAFQLGGVPRPTCPVSVQVGELEKELSAIGHRFWLSNHESTDPIPFVQMPITWANAYGGPSFAKNPEGKGADEVETPHGKVRPLPNIETPGAFVRSSKDVPEPAGLGPIDFVNPRRFSKAGTYDGDYLKEHFPGPAPDLDWTIYNVAPEDQQSQTFFRGDEPIVVHGMHPEKPRLEAHLPSVQARCFLAQGGTELESFHEVAMRLSTVWLFPHAERYLLVFHGAHKVAEDDAADVLHGIFALEDLGQPKPIEHYHAAFSRRLDPEKGAVYALRDHELLPLDPALHTAADSTLEAMKALLDSEELGEKYQHERMKREFADSRAKVVAVGLDPDVVGPAMPPPMPEAPADLEELAELNDKMAEELAEAEQRAEAIKEEMKARIRPKLEKYGMDADAILNEPDEPQIGPPTYRAQEEIDRLIVLRDDCRSKGYPIAELDEYTTDPERREVFDNFERCVMDGYRELAHHQGEAPRLEGEAAARARARVVAMAASGESFDTVDFTGVDLSGLDLSGANLEGGFFESALLEGTVLRGANLSRTVLARAEITGSDLSGANLGCANLGKATVTRTNLDDADLSTAILEKANITRTTMRSANLDDANLSQTSFAETDATAARLAQIQFLKADLRGLRLAGAVFTDSSFIEGNLSGVDLSGADLEELTLIDVIGDGANFAGARMVNLRCVKGCSFERSNFSGADLTDANMRGTKLRDCDFSDGNLTRADFSECDLERSKLDRVSARDSMFVRAKLTDASLTSADLMDAILQKSELSGTDLRGANLFQADLALARSEGRTLLEAANQKKVRVHPIWKPQA